MDWTKQRGIFAVYKPVGPTSHDIIDQLRRLTGEKRIGHAGTLDPLASGVLVVAVGRDSTKLLASEVEKEKEYLAAVRLGMTSATDDADGEKQEHVVTAIPTLADIQKVVPRFIGNIQQVPPAYSAIKRGGRKAYKAARSGKPLELGARTVEIKSLEIVDYAWPVLSVRVVTGSGAYIRSLARDIGQALGVGGYIETLERLRVGEFSKESAILLPARQAHVKR